VTAVLVTGGAGFVGANLVDRLVDAGCRVRILDDLSRPGVERNAAWLTSRHGDRVDLWVADVRDRSVVEDAVRGTDAVFHLAAQVAVTTSLDDPRTDFEINALGTLNVLEAVRRRSVPPLLVYTSTNKVYGGLEDVHVRLLDGRYAPDDATLARHGLSEARPLAFHSPYGCSKGASDQYVLDHARTYGLPATVLRMSCIYGPRQLGNEDQGWVAHFLRTARAGGALTIYGDGRQVRDVLYVDDLVDLMVRVLERPEPVVGRAFNVGGGPAHTTSLLELVDLLEERLGRRPEVAFDAWRRADQRWFVSDPRAIGDALGWRPRTSLEEGLARLDDWVTELATSQPAPVRTVLDAAGAT
jgi:CDP-paratose 2-epimerase